MLLHLLLFPTKALNLSKEIGFHEGICGAILHMVFTREKKGDIAGAFQLAVSLKAIDFEVSILDRYTYYSVANVQSWLKILGHLH